MIIAYLILCLYLFLCSEALSRSPPDISAANNVGTPKEEGQSSLQVILDLPCLADEDFSTLSLPVYFFYSYQRKPTKVVTT